MKDTSTVGWRLRQSNPVPGEAFGGAAGDSIGRATFERIVASPALSPEPARRRLALRLALPAIAGVVAAATATAVALSNVSAPRQLSYTLDTLLTVHPQAHPGDAAAVLRLLAARAAAQPAQALGPVEYSSNRAWGYAGVSVPRSLYYFSRHSYTNQAWDAVSGASAVRIVRDYDRKVFTSSYAAAQWSAQFGAWINPVTLPASPSALRAHLLDEPGSGAGKVYWYATYTQGGTQTITGEDASRSALRKELRQEVKAAHGSITNVRIHKIGSFGFLSWQTVFIANAIRFMTGEPLPPATASSMLRVLAQIAAHPGHGYRYVDMGTATDHLGRAGVVIGQEEGNDAGPHYVGLESLIFDPRTGALLDMANAQCEIAMGAIPTATGQCVPTSYTEFNAPKAVAAVPAYPAHIPGLSHQAGGPYI